MLNRRGKFAKQHYRKDSGLLRDKISVVIYYIFQTVNNSADN